MPVNIFFCYAHEDEDLLNKLKRQLWPLQRQGLIAVWHDRDISAGTEWEREISQHLNAAHIILLLVSPDFMFSEYCYSVEMKRALERHDRKEAIVIPVIVRPVYWQGVLGNIQALPTDAKPVVDRSWHTLDEAFYDVAEGIRTVVEELRAKSNTATISPLTSRSLISFLPPTDLKTIQQREEDVKDIYTKLMQPDMTGLVLTGIGGLGKSTLAALVYRYAEEQRRAEKGAFTAETLWLTIEPAVTMVDLATTLFEGLDKPVPDFSSLFPYNQALALFQVLNTVAKPRLIVLDQFENLLDWRTGHALPDRPGVGEWLDVINNQASTCRILLTSRPWPQGTHESPPTYIQEYPVNGLNTDEGMALLRKQGVSAIQATEAELRIAIARCEGHALALKLLASILRSNRSLSLALLFDDPIYNYLWTGNIARSFLDYIYKHQLDEMQRKVLQAFSIYREPVSLNVARALIPEVSAAHILDALNILLTQHLLNAVGEGRYQLHTIVASYVRAHFIEDNEQANQEALRIVHAKAAQYYQQQAATSCSVREERRGARDIHDLIEAVWQQCQAKQLQEAYDLMKREEIFSGLNRWGANAILLELYQLLLPLDQWNPEVQQKADIYADLGEIHSALGQKEDALKSYERALSNYRQVRDRRGEGRILSNFGRVYNALGQKERAVKYYEEALIILREVGDRQIEGKTLNNLGRVYRVLGQTSQALMSSQNALKILREVGDRREEGRALNDLGRIYRVLRWYDQALQSCEEALTILREVGDRGGEGRTRSNLGLIYADLGDNNQALKYYEEALNILREVRDRGIEGITLNHLGEIYAKLGEKERQRQYYQEALKIFREVGDRWEEGRTLHSLGKLYFNQGYIDVALACFLLAKSILEEVQYPNRGSMQRWINKLRKNIGDEQFAVLLAQVEPGASQIVEQALHALQPLN